MKLTLLVTIVISIIIAILMIGCDTGAGPKPKPEPGPDPDPGPGPGPNFEPVNFLAGEVKQGDAGQPQFNLQIGGNNARYARSAGSVRRSARNIAGIDLPTAGAEYPLSGEFFIPPELLPDGAEEGILLSMEGFYDDASGKFLASAATEDLRYTVSGIFDADGQLVGEPIVSAAEKEGENWVPEVFLSEIKEPDVHEIEPPDDEEGGLPREYQGRWVSSYSFSLSSATGEQNEMHLIASAWYVNMEHRHIDREGKLTLTHERWTIISAESLNGGYDIILAAPDYNNVGDDVRKAAEAEFYQEKGITFAPLGGRTIAAALESGEPFIDDQGNWYNHWEAWSEYCFSGALEKYIIEQGIPPGNKYMKINLSLSPSGILIWKYYSLLGLQGRQVLGDHNVFATLEDAEAVTTFGGNGLGIPGIGGHSFEEFQKRFYRAVPGRVEPPAINLANSSEQPDGAEITLTPGTTGAELYYSMGNQSIDITNLDEYTKYTGPFALRYNGNEESRIDVLSMKEGMYSTVSSYYYTNTSDRYTVTLNNEGVGHTDPEENNYFEVGVNLTLDSVWHEETETLEEFYALAPGEITLYYISYGSKAAANFDIVITETEGGAVIPHTGNNVDGFVFTMPAKPITITASGDFEYSGYTVTVIGGGPGARVDPWRAEEGETVYLTVSEDADIESITVKNNTSGDEFTPDGPVPGNIPGEVMYTFTMPAYDVTVYAEFEWES